MALTFSQRKTDNVTGQIQSNHSLPRAQLHAIVEDALRAALIYDHEQQRPASKVDGLRTDNAERQPAQNPRDEATDAMKDQWKKGGQR